MNTPEFRLNEFRDIAKWIRKKFPGPIAYFLNGWLYALESAWIASKARSAVEKAIAPHLPPEPVTAPPRYLREPSEVDGLDSIGFTYETLH